MAIVGALLVIAAGASAEPRGHDAAEGFTWTAPPACPQLSELRARVERRLGGPIDELPDVAIKVWRTSSSYVARIDPRNQELARSARTLHSGRCDVLADAVAVVVARLAADQVREPAPVLEEEAAPPVVAMVDEAALVEADAVAAPVVVRKVALHGPSRWGGGLHVLGLSGVGALPQINLGVEVTGLVRYNQRFVSVGVSRWVPQSAANGDANVELSLVTSVVRAGWSPTHLALRAWGLAEVGRMQGPGINVDNVRTGAARWLSLGAGFGVAWPMAKHARLIGTFEMAVPLERARFMLTAGSDLYQPAFAAARCALGLEVGWQ